MADVLKVRSWSEIQDSGKLGVYADHYSSLGGTIWLLKSGSFSIRNFVEFCNFVEAVVLFPRVYISPNPCPIAGNSLRKVDEFTNMLATEGALAFVEMPRLPTDDAKNCQNGEKEFHTGWRKMRDVLLQHHRIVGTETVMGVAAHTIYGMTLYPSVHNRFAYLESLRVSNSIRVTLSLQAAYKSLSQATQQAVRSIGDYRGVEDVYIPPIPAIIMTKASSLHDIPYILLELRKRFAPVRKAFTEFDFTISDPSTPLKKSLRAMNLLKTIVEEISRPFDDQGRRVIAQWADLGELVPYDKDFDADDAKSITKLLLGKPLEFILSRLKRRRFLPLYSLRNDYLRRGDTHMLIKKLWNYDLTNDDASVGQKYIMTPMDLKKEHRAPHILPPDTFSFDIWGNR